MTSHGSSPVAVGELTIFFRLSGDQHHGSLDAVANALQTLGRGSSSGKKKTGGVLVSDPNPLG